MKVIIAFWVSCWLSMTALAGSTSVVSLATYPINEQSDVPVDSLIKVYSSTPGSGDFMFNLYDATGQAYVDGHSYVDISGVIFKPSTLLNPGNRYIAQYSSLTNAKKRATWAFTTSIPDTKPIGSFSIEDNTVDVDIYSEIELRLDNTLNIDDVEVSLKNESTQEFVDVNLVDSQSLVLISPVSPLTYSAAYTLSVSSNLVEYSQPTVVNFSTSSKNTELVDSIHIPSESSGYTLFRLVPDVTIKEQKDARVTFGAPFPKGFVASSDSIRVLDEQNNEIPIVIISTLEWLNDEDDQKSIRSAVIQLDIDFYGQENGRLLKLAWGELRTSSDIEAVTIDSTWLPVDDVEFSLSEGIREPNAYALFGADWYGKSVIKSRLLPLKSNSEFSAYDAAFYAFGKTAINHVDPRVVENKLLPYKTSYAAWLFDRATTLYQLAFRTGELRFIRSAHRASQFYKKKINERGYFSLKPSNDMKYSYGESLVSNFILTGDPTIPNIIESMVPAWDTFSTLYTLNTNFWTERHAAFQLKGYTTAFEITGKDEYKFKAEKVFSDLRTMQTTPSSGVPMTGALMHTATSHGEYGPHFIASPWMSVLLIDAVERYSIHISDNEVADFVLALARYFQQPGVALWEWKGFKGDLSHIVPFYLAGTDLTPQQHSASDSDIEHTPDVSKIFALAYYYSCRQGACDSSFLLPFSQLRKSQNTYTFPYWIRMSAPAVGYTAYRLSPPRKFSWWFGSSANNDFLLNSVTSKFDDLNKEAGELSLDINQEIIGNGRYTAGSSYKVKIKLTNNSDIGIKNAFIQTYLKTYAPSELIELVSIAGGGYDHSGNVIWKIDSLASGESTEGLSFEFKIKDFPVLLNENRQLDDIIIKSRYRYCLESSVEPECVVGKSNWDVGIQPFTGYSKWHSISMVAPTSPPEITVTNLTDGEAISGVVSAHAEIVDEHSIGKVEFKLNGELVGSFLEPPFAVDIESDKLSDKMHTLEVVAWDKVGSRANKVVSFYSANPDLVAPTIELKAPKANVNYCNSVAVEYEASDASGVKNCSLTLDDGLPIYSKNCSSFIVPAQTPLFSAKSYLPFDAADGLFESINDQSLKGVGTEISSITRANSSGIEFTQDSSQVTFAEHDIDISNDISVAFWLKPSQDEGVIASQDWYYIGVEYGWAISLGPNNHKSNNSMAITWSSGNNGHNANEKNIVQSEPNSITLNNWHHVAVVKKDELVSIYIDGELAIQKTIQFASIAWPHTSKKVIALGKPMKHTLNYNKGYIGGLDEFAIWDAELSATEVKELYQGNHSNKLISLKLQALDKAGNQAESIVQVGLKSCSE